MSVRPVFFSLWWFVSVVLTVAGSLAQETPPEFPPIPAIPGIPSSKGSAPAKPSQVFPTTPGPGLVMPGLGSATGTAAVKAERLRPKFQPGNTYRFVIKTELQSRTATGAAGALVMEQQARFDAKVRVDGKAGVVLKARTERLDLTLSSGGSTLFYESLKPDDQETPLGRHLRASLNRSVDLTLDEKGQVDVVSEGGSGDETALLPGVPRLGPDELAHVVSGLTQGFSEKRVGPGDEWQLQGSRSIGGVGSMNFDLTYRHVGQVSFEGSSCLSIEFAGTLTGTLPGMDPATTADFQASGMRGRVYLDPLDEMVRFGEQNIDLWITRAASGADPGGQVPVRQTTTLRLLHVIPTP